MKKLVCMAAIEVNEADLKASTVVKILVKDAAGNTMAGVTIIVKGTQIGTTTDAYGNAMLICDTDGTLVFSFVGYITQEVNRNGRSVLEVTLKEESGILQGNI